MLQGTAPIPGAVNWVYMDPTPSSRPLGDTRAAPAKSECAGAVIITDKRSGECFSALVAQFEVLRLHDHVANGQDKTFGVDNDAVAFTLRPQGVCGAGVGRLGNHQNEPHQNDACCCFHDRSQHRIDCLVNTCGLLPLE